MITVATTITNAIDAHLIEREARSNEERQARRATRGPKIYPSLIGYCTRYIVYDMLGYEKRPMPPHIIRTCNNGDDMHARYQRLFSEMGLLVATEYPIKDDELNLSGRVDGIIYPGYLYPEYGDDLAVLELKSAKDRYFKEMQRKQAPLDKYLDQIQLYLELLRMPRGLMIVENKNDQAILEMWIDRDQIHGQYLIQKIHLVNRCVKNNTLPPRDYAISSYTCKWCDFKDICWS